MTVVLATFHTVPLVLYSAVPFAPTVTNPKLSANVTPFRFSVVPLVCNVQFAPLVLYKILPLSPTVTNLVFELSYAISRSVSVTLVCIAFAQVIPLLLVTTVPPSPTPQKLPFAVINE